MNGIGQYYSYDDDGKQKLNLQTVLFGGYNQEQTKQMVQELRDYYNDRIVHLVNELAERDKQLEKLRNK